MRVSWFNLAIWQACKKERNVGSQGEMGLAPHPSGSTSPQVRLNYTCLCVHALNFWWPMLLVPAHLAVRITLWFLISTIKTLQHSDMNPAARSGSKNTFTASKYACFFVGKAVYQKNSMSKFIVLENRRSIKVSGWPAYILECTLYSPVRPQYVGILYIQILLIFILYRTHFFNTCSLCSVCDFGDSFCIVL